MKVTEVAEDLFWLKFRTSRAAARTFLRVQEHFESPHFRGEIFTVREFNKWFRHNYNADYYDCYEGFNIPSYALRPFLQGKFDPLNNAEKKLIDLFRERQGKYYVIGSAKDSDTLTLKHELAHGLYYLNDEYRKEVDKLLNKVDLTSVKSTLEKLGYHPDTWQDEAHAYLICSQEYLEGENGEKFKLPADIGYKLQILFDQHFKPLGRSLPKRRRRRRQG